MEINLLIGITTVNGLFTESKIELRVYAVQFCQLEVKVWTKRLYFEHPNNFCRQKLDLQPEVGRICKYCFRCNIISNISNMYTNVFINWVCTQINVSETRRLRLSEDMFYCIVS